MTEQRIILLPELVQQWMAEWMDEFDKQYQGDMYVAPGQVIIDIAKRAAQWGHDQCLKELEAAMSDIVPPPEDFKPESELVIRVAEAIGGNDYSLSAEAWEDTARVAIRQVANWIKEHKELIIINHFVADDLLSEANK